MNLLRTIGRFIAASFAPCNTGWPRLPAGNISNPGIVGHRKLR